MASRKYIWHLVSCFLLLISVYGADDDEDFCKEYIYGAKVIPSQVSGVAESAFSINHAFPLGDVVVPVSIIHPRISDLRITLSTEADQLPGAKSRMIKRITLKDEGHGSGNNMSVVFTDRAEQGPQSLNTMTKPVKPVQSLSFLYKTQGRPSVVAASGGTQGTWTLKVEDMATDESVRIDPAVDWSLILCQIDLVSSDTKIDPVTQNPTVGAAVSDAIQAFAGKAQPMAWTVNTGSDKDVEFADNFDSYLNTFNKDCGTPEECDAMKQRMWKSAATLMYMGMKNHLGSNDASISRISDFLQKVANRTKTVNGAGDRWKPGQHISSLVGGASNLAQQMKEQSQGILSTLGNTISKLPYMENIKPFGEKPDKVIWSRSLTLDDVADTVKSARSDLAKKMESWKPASTVKSMLQNGERSIPDFSDIESSLGSIVSQISEKSQNWMEQRSATRGNFVSSIESSLGEVQKKLEGRISDFSDWKPRLPDMSSIKSKLEDSRSQLRANLKDLEMPAENFKKKLGTAVENTVKKQLETAISDENLERVVEAVNNTNLNSTDILRSFEGIDLSSLIPQGLDLNFRHGLSLDGPLGEELVGQLLGIDDPEETKALVDGLKQAGFQDLMTEFLNPALL